jgi:nucleotide-binding universal stress UspA family protein
MDQSEIEAGRLLLLVDGSAESMQAETYVAKLAHRRCGFHVCLLQVLPPFPPELLEFGGAEDSHKEQQLESDLRHEQEAWISSAKSSAMPQLERSRRVLHNAGVPNHEIELEFSDPMQADNAAEMLLEQAAAKRCHTVVVGHTSHSWFREVVGRHLAEELLRRARGVTIWVVQ